MTNPILYILIRNDLPSMNPGKAMAQASHASNAFLHKYEIKMHSLDEKTRFLVESWKNSTTQGFGTVLVLSASLTEIEKTVFNSNKMGYHLSDLVVDPTYPYIVNSEIAYLISTLTDTEFRRELDNNQVLLFRKEITCGYIFGDKEDISFLVDKFELHK